MKKPILNKLIKIMAKKQNKKHVMNAGQLREAVSLFYKAFVELDFEERILIIDEVRPIINPSIKKEIKKAAKKKVVK